MDVWGRCVGDVNTWAPVDGRCVVVIINGVMGERDLLFAALGRMVGASLTRILPGLTFV